MEGDNGARNPGDGTSDLLRQLGLLTRDQVCQALGIGPEGLRRRIYLGRFPRPLHGQGARARWRERDVMQAIRPGWER